VTPALVIFDCDGVLVDSEPLANAVLARALTAAGYRVSIAECIERFTGLSMPSVVATVETGLGHPLPPDFLDRVQTETFARFRKELQPVPGVREVLEGIALPKCVASSGEPEKIDLSLTVTGLKRYFGDRIFSARMVARGKPFPDLFLHAAGAMAVAPEAAVVVEDSVPGVKSGAAARMRVLGYAAGPHGGPTHARRLAEAGAEPFFAMADLPGLLETG